MVTTITRSVYGLFSALFLIIGVGAMLVPTGWLPPDIAERAIAGETLNPFFAHLLQEFGTLVIGVGLVFVWLAARAEFVAGLHWLLTLYLSLDGLIHWVGPDGVIGSWSRGAFNSIPPVVMLVLGILRLRETGPAAGSRHRDLPVS